MIFLLQPPEVVRLQAQGHHVWAGDFLRGSIDSFLSHRLQFCAPALALSSSCVLVPQEPHSGARQCQPQSQEVSHLPAQPQGVDFFSLFPLGKPSEDTSSRCHASPDWWHDWSPSKALDAITGAGIPPEMRQCSCSSIAATA